MSSPYRYEINLENQEPFVLESKDPISEFVFKTVNGRLESIEIAMSEDKPKTINTQSELPKLSPSQIARFEEMFPIDVRGKNVSIGYIK